MEKKELIFVPLSIGSHYVSTIELAKRLIDLDDAIQITVFWLKFHDVSYLKSLVASKSAIRVIELPEVQDLPSMELFEESPEAYMLAVANESLPIIKQAISGILSSGSSQVMGIIHDFFFEPLSDVAKELGVPSYIYMTSGAGFLACLSYAAKRCNEISSAFGEDSDERLLIPGFANLVPSQVLPSAFFNQLGYETFAELGRRTEDSSGIIVNTFTSLESHALGYLKDQSLRYPPVYPVGPLLGLNVPPHPNLDPAERDKIMGWLDQQPHSSVVFVCFGSLGEQVPTQAKEVALGLELSGHRFLWVVSVVSLPEGFEDRTAGQGMVCRWAPQVAVLGHKAVGGFVSHCGWNSTLEAVWHCVPILAWPMYAEQQLNAFILVEQLGLAEVMKMDYRRNKDVLKAEEIARGIKTLMESDDGTRKKKAKEMAEKARKALLDGGSSSLAIKQLLNHIVGNVGAN